MECIDNSQYLLAVRGTGNIGFPTDSDAVGATGEMQVQAAGSVVDRSPDGMVEQGVAVVEFADQGGGCARAVEDIQGVGSTYIELGEIQFNLCVDEIAGADRHANILVRSITGGSTSRIGKNAGAGAYTASVVL